MARKPWSTKDLELDKFDTNADNETIVRTSAVGTFSPTGLSTEGKVTPLTVSTTAVKLPSTALSGRNAISIHNKDASATLYIGFDNTVTADSTSTGGWEIPAGNYFNTDITDAVEIWGISTTLITVKVLEIA